MRFVPVHRVRDVVGSVLRRTVGVAWTALIVVSCSTGDSLLFLTDTLFESAFLDEGANGQLVSTTTSLGIELDRLTVDRNVSSETFIDTLAETKAKFVVVTPFLADLAASAAPVYRDRRFIVLYGAELSPQENIQRLAPDRSTAFHAAGAFSARLLRYFSEQGVDPVRILVLAYVADPRRARELDTFLAGYEKTADLGLSTPEVRRFSTLQEGRSVARTMASSWSDYELVLVALSTMNADVLSSLSKSDGTYVITEGFGRDLPAEERIVAVIVEDWIGAIAEAIESRNPRVVIPSRLVPGPGWSRLRAPAGLFDATDLRGPTGDSSSK